MGKVWFVGAGPGDPELLTLKGRALIERSGAILYAGSLVSEAATRWAPTGCEIRDSKDMTLEEIADWLIAKARAHETVVRLQTGDPTLYGALIEMVQPLDAAGVEIGVVPGVSSAMASAAAAAESLTLPEVTQTVILTRIEGRTPMPVNAARARAASLHAVRVSFHHPAAQGEREPLAAGWSADAPVLVVHKASWPGEEKLIRGTLADIRDVPRGESHESGHDYRQPPWRAPVAGIEEIEIV